MFHATKSKMAASAASGTWCANGAASSITSSRATACTMPATGLVAPLLALVTVRAIVPVAGIPPKNGVTKLAIPCAMSSWLGSWRSPMMPSATCAHSSDSMAPNKASVIVGITSSRADSQEKTGHCSPGRLEGIPPKRLPMVSTCSPSAATATLASSSATTDPGTSASTLNRGRLLQIFGIIACHPTISARQASASARAWTLRVSMAPASTPSMPKKWAGTGPVTSPSKSRICETAISTAMPLVNPITTATGTKRISVPSLSHPIRNSSTPDIAVASTRLARP